MSPLSFVHHFLLFTNYSLCPSETNGVYHKASPNFVSGFPYVVFVLRLSSNYYLVFRAHTFCGALVLAIIFFMIAISQDVLGL